MRLGAAIHSVRAVPPLAMAEVAGWAGLQGWRLHAHVSEQRKEQTECVRYRGTTPLGVLAAAGAVNQRFTAVHGTHFSLNDITGLATDGGGCCCCPTTERDLGDGIGPSRRCMRDGVPLCFGTDSHALIDGFEEARAVEMDARPANEERGLFSPAALLEAATEDGMNALGWDAGVLAPGRLADFITIGLDCPVPLVPTRRWWPPPCLPPRRRTSMRSSSAASKSWRAASTSPFPGRRCRTSRRHRSPLRMSSLALTDIGVLVTCDAEHGRGPLGIVECAALVVDGGVVVYAGPASARPPRTRRSTSEVVACCPASSIPTPI